MNTQKESLKLRKALRVNLESINKKIFDATKEVNETYAKITDKLYEITKEVDEYLEALGNIGEKK